MRLLWIPVLLAGFFAGNINAATNVTASPVINFNPVINVNPNISSVNNNSNKNTNDNKSSVKLDKLHGNKSSPEVKKLLGELNKIEKSMVKLEKKEFNFEELRKNFGSEKESQDLLKSVKDKLAKELVQLTNKHTEVIKKIKKVEKTKRGVILFKTKRLEREWNKMIKSNNPLVSRLIAVSNFVKTKFNKPIVLTEIERTQAEQNKLYGSKRKKRSWHQFNAALDFRSRIFTGPEIVQIVSFMKKFEKDNALRLTILYHNAGFASHFHFQFRNKKK